MSPEREKRENQIVLTATQEQVAGLLLETLKRSEGKEKICIVEGLSGCGKTMMLSKIEDRIVLNGGEVVDPNTLMYGFRRSENEKEEFKRNIIVPATPKESRLIQEQATQKDIVSKVFILSGMNEEEIIAYIQTLPDSDEITLSKGEIIKYSLGIPLLVQRLREPGLSTEQALRVVARFLRSNLGYVSGEEKLASFADRYLKMKIPVGIFPVLLDIGDFLSRSQHVYDNLYEVLGAREGVERRTGVEEESALFLSSRSEEIYDLMLKSEGRASIDIFVPEIEKDDFERITGAFGYDGWQYEQNGVRMKMFGAIYRKVSFWHMNSFGKEFVQDSEYPRMPDFAKEYLRLFKKGKLHCRPSGKRNYSSFYVHAHEHNGMTYHPAQVGWAVESLLQQRGVPYFVNNDTAGLSYAYQPETESIEVFQERVIVKFY